jgi:hypothetical protein
MGTCSLEFFLCCYMLCANAAYFMTNFWTTLTSAGSSESGGEIMGTRVWGSPNSKEFNSVAMHSDTAI